ncbi:tetratricopeptide repeat protein 22-like [Acanthaster planci]|uniref:Tetratricopeptide repeat protein 22-like n=1 Tax=Acanthaster planci TaxID=133434 RepID=A0A8B7ZG26_ACAPL|nr:tetratricopeptide repeat protein 22-like [Acanthaster planci]XP_022102197.1 tetratricopeptide repeat protein 22-like [Acanthaster planci]
MASDTRTLTPGNCMLPLLINKKIDIDKTVVETKLIDLRHFLEVKTGYPEEFAILNVIGLLNLRLHRYEDALKCFHEVLSKDPENLNALANLQYVLEKLFKLAEAQTYKERWCDLLHSTESETDSAEPGAIAIAATKKQRCSQARCLAEQAYSHTFDIHSDNAAGKRAMQSIELYQEALTMAGEDVEETERNEWKFCVAVNEHKLFTSSLYFNQPDSNKPEVHLQNALKLFSELTQAGRGKDKEILWDSWCHLGDIFRVMKLRKTCQCYVSPNLTVYRNDPKKCMTKALEISPHNARLLERYGNFVYSLFKDRKESLKLLNNSIDEDNSVNNWRAFSTRAMVNLKHYKSQKTQNAPRLRGILESALSDLEKAVSMNATPWNLTQLGESHYHLAKHHTDDDGQAQSHFLKALVYLTKSIDSPDGRNRPDVHFWRGRCLFDIGEKRAAISCFKQAIACETPHSENLRNFNKLFKVYLTMLRDEDPLEDNSILAEIAHAAKGALEKYDRRNMSTWCINKFRSEYKKELLLLQSYCRKFRALEKLVSLLEESPWHSSRFSRRTPTVPFDCGHRSFGAAAGTHVPRVKMRPVTEEKVDIKPPIQADSDEDETVAHMGGAVGGSSHDIPEPVTEEEEQPIKKAPKEARASNFTYDFLVTYPKNERDWVSYDLLPQLEDVHHLRGCTRDRDALAGEMKITSEINLMKECASILLIISRDFISECEGLMHYALQLRKERQCSRVVIPVCRDETPVPDEIGMILNTFDATGAVDWDKLAF